MNLPHHRRYQWQFVWREWRNAVYLSMVALIVAFLVLMGILFLFEQNERLASELNHKSLIVDVHRLATFGAPGYVRNDWTENTTKVKVRKPDSTNTIHSIVREPR